MHHLELLGPQLGGHEAEHAHAPRLVAQPLGGLGEQLAHLVGG